MSKKNLSWLLAGVASLFVAEDASAGFKVRNSNNALRPYVYLERNTNQYAYAYAEDWAADNHSTVVTERVSTRQTVEAQISLIHSRLADRTMSGAAAGSKSGELFSLSGLNAGGVDGANGLWTNGRWDHIKDDTTGGKWDANLYSFALGFDHRFNQRFLAGVAVHYQYMRGDTAFNQGNIRDHGYGVTPYMTFKAADWLDLDVIAGYSRFTKKRTRTQMANIPNANGPTGIGQKVSGSPKSDRYFASFFANFSHRVQKWDFLGRLGYLHAQDNQKTFTETNGDQYNKLKTKINRLSLRLQAGYKVNEMVSPYLFALYARDLTQTKHGLASTLDGGQFEGGAPGLAGGGAATLAVANPEENISKNTWGAGLGLRFNSGKRLSGGLEYQYTANKKVKTNTVNLNVKYKF